MAETLYSHRVSSILLFSTILYSGNNHLQRSLLEAKEVNRLVTAISKQGIRTSQGQDTAFSHRTPLCPHSRLPLLGNLWSILRN